MNKLLALLLLIAAQVKAEAPMGLAAYGLQSRYWNDATGLAWFRGEDEKAISILWSSFGNRMAGIERFFMLPGKKFLQVHSFRRDDKPGDRAYQARIKEITEALRPWCSLPTVECAVSTGLEHVYSKRRNAQLLRLTRAIWPWKVVNNPMVRVYEQNIPGFDYLESHGLYFKCPAKSQCIANNDGFDVRLPIRGRRNWPHDRSLSMSQLSAYAARQSARRNNRVVFIWWRECNGRENTSDPNYSSNRLRRRNYITSNQVSLVKRALP